MSHSRGGFIHWILCQLSLNILQPSSIQAIVRFGRRDAASFCHHDRVKVKKGTILLHIRSLWAIQKKKLDMTLPSLSSIYRIYILFAVTETLLNEWRTNMMKIYYMQSCTLCWFQQGSFFQKLDDMLYRASCYTMTSNITVLYFCPWSNTCDAA